MLKVVPGEAVEGQCGLTVPLRLSRSPVETCPGAPGPRRAEGAAAVVAGAAAATGAGRGVQLRPAHPQQPRLLLGARYPNQDLQ